MNWFPTPKFVLKLAIAITIELILAFSVAILVYSHYHPVSGADWPSDVAAKVFDQVVLLVAGWIPLVLSLADGLACTLLLIAGGHRPKEWVALALSAVMLLISTFFSFIAVVGQ